MVQGATRIQIPPRFNEILGDSALGNSLRLYVQRFDAWVGDDTKGLFFFPEYTDHGPRHITSVLFGAEALIREEAWKAVTREDVAVFVAATLFHDAAMHLTADGFLSLIDPARTGERPLVRLLDNTTWPELFAAYYSEARKWDQRRLHRILGDEAVPQEEEPDLMDSVRRPEEMPNPETWTVRYRKFLGEFVRRHHARLAHEIALYGYPGHTPDILRLPAELASFADLAGLVARSHNMYLRDTFDYLQQKHWGRLTCQNAHPVFLMVILRIADYLEVRSDRINSTALAIQRLRSPISVEEQSNHLAVHEVRPDEHDEEAIFVIARPPSARLFLKLQSLLKGLQSELDTSWAVLGEVYSKQPNLSCFGIRLRRVRSNLDVPSEYLRREEPPYFPVRAAFDTTGADLLKLLIKPLYGDRPDIGVRELLQNALDAVHELRVWAADHGDPKMEKVPLPDQEADVLISIDEDEAGEAWLTVRDKGIGMTVEVVRDYFLKAGASYRESPAWRRSFEDEKGARVLRSGRFGIGALAAFLLGDFVKVASRHIAEPAEEGVTFSASMACDLIELQRTRLAHIGSTVQVKLSQSALRYLSADCHRWDWYILDDPRVELRMFGGRLNQSLVLSLPGGGRSDNFLNFSHSVFSSIYWGYLDEKQHLICNGIRVKEVGPSFQRILPRLPTLCVFDPDGRLPLTLQRQDTVSAELPFRAELEVELAREICAFLLLHAPVSAGPLRVAGSWPNLFGTLESAYGDGGLWPFCFAASGIILAHSRCIDTSMVRHCLCFVFDEDDYVEVPYICSSDATMILWSSGRSVADWEGILYNLGFLDRSSYGVVSRARTDGSPWLDTEEALDDIWVVRTSRDFSFLGSSLENVFASIGGESSEILAVFEWSFQEAKKTPNTAFTRTLEDILDTPIIPYDPDERRRRLPGAFSKLEKYLERWHPDNLTGWRRDTVRWFLGEQDREE